VVLTRLLRQVKRWGGRRGFEDQTSPVKIPFTSCLATSQPTKYHTSSMSTLYQSLSGSSVLVVLGLGTPSNMMCLCFQRLSTLSRTSIHSAILAQCSCMTNRSLWDGIISCNGPHSVWSDRWHFLDSYTVNSAVTTVQWFCGRVLTLQVSSTLAWELLCSAATFAKLFRTLYLSVAEHYKLVPV